MQSDDFRPVHLSPDNDYGLFEITNLEPSLGTALGNALRRVLLSDIPGFATKSIKIGGVLHEFSTIPGVREDVTEIVLNIKALRMHSFTDGDKVLWLKAEGPCVVRAKDIQPNFEVSILNPDAYICTLGEGAKIDLQIIAGHGKGYVSAEDNRREGASIGTIPVDSLYSPIQKVNCYVRQNEMGSDVLMLEVWTDRTIAPLRAVNLAAQKLAQLVHAIHVSLA